MELRPFRRELKFVVHHSTKERLLARWSRFLRRAAFTNENAVTPILSLYYDSPQLTFYHEKVDGIHLRNKVRLRVYGMDFRAGQTAFLEIKHRQGDLVRKWRQHLPKLDPAWLDPGVWHFDDPAMATAFCTLRERHRLRPTAQVYYQREAYEGLVESDVRVTFDTNLIGLHPGEKLTRGLLCDRSRHLMPETLSILEVKTTQGLPRWVHEGVVAAELEQRTVPKYITAVEILDLPRLYGSGVYV